MYFWTFLLLLIVFGGIGLVQLLNSETRAGALARTLATGIIHKLVGSQKDSLASDDVSVAEKTGG